jgi:Kelch motif
MVKFKMIGRDINSSPTQYRTWVVNEEPDFTGSQYSGLKSGDSPLIDIQAYLIPNDAVADFNLPNPLKWSATNKVLPSPVANSQAAIIDGYAYLFGGKVSGKIYRAHLDNPTSWEDTQAQLPSPLYGSQLVIIGDFIYLIGGNDNTGPSSHIWGASVNEPLTWFDLGSQLPSPVQNAQAIITNNSIYLLGGKSDGYTVLNTVYTASVSDPLNWANLGSVLPQSLHSSQVAIIDGYTYLFGGLGSNNNMTDSICKASINNLSNWSISGTLPSRMANGQFFIVGDKGYLITPAEVISSPRSSGTRIFQCSLNDPNQWIDTLKNVPGEVSESQIVVIYDRVFLLGGNANTVIYSCEPEYKYLLTSLTVIEYGYVTRTQVNNASSKLDLFEILGFPPWKTDL